MTCPCCANTGYRTVEVPIFVDGGYSDVDQITDRCRCNPEATDADAPDYDVCDGCWAPPGTTGRCIGCRAPIPPMPAPTDADWTDQWAGWDAPAEAPEPVSGWRPSDETDLPDWQDVPELWARDYPGIDYDAAA